ncbi:glycosyltransferase [bacterium]|nr:glycosyltransferase [bacterium]
MFSNDSMSKNMRRPEVTVLMAVFNGERYPREAIESILEQTFKNFEFIIVNDGSTDLSCEILSSYSDSRIRLVDNEQNIGLACSLNKGLSLARGEFVARMDADDISYPDRLKKQVDFMRANPAVAVLGTQVAYIDTVGRDIKVFAPRHPVTPLAAKYTLMFGTPVSHPTVMYRKNLIWEIFKGYDKAYNVSEDTELWCRVGIDYSIQNLPDVLVAMRVHPQSVSYDSSHPRRSNHVSMWLKRLPKVVRDILGEDTIPEEWVKWWVQIYNFHCHIGKNASLQLLNGLDRIQELFVEKYPEARSNKEIPKLSASYKAQVALHLVETERLASTVAFARVIKSDRRIAFLYVPKFLGLFLLGRWARKAFRKKPRSK